MRPRPEGEGGRHPAGRRSFLADLLFLGASAAALIVPSWLSTPARGRPVVGGSIRPLRPIDANRAPWYEWALIEGIGEVRAKRIVARRAERGGFRSLEDLEDVPGMPRGWTQKIKDRVKFDGAR